MPTHLLLTSLLILVLAMPSRAQVRFTRDIAPIVLKRCAGCHGERANLGGYRAHTFQNLMRPGASARAAITPRKPTDSRLFQLITSTSSATRMPKSDDPLSAEQIELFRRWIQEGAKFDGGDPSAPIKSLLGPRRHPAAPASYRTAVPVLALAFAPDGKEIYVGGYNEVTVWSAVTGALLRRLGHQPQRIQTVAFSPDGKSLLVAGGTPGDYGELARSGPNGENRHVLDTLNDTVLCAAFSSDGKRIAAGSADGTVRLYNTMTDSRIWSNKVHSDWVTSVSFSSDGKYLASASKDMTIKIYEAESGALFTTYNGHNRQLGTYKGQAAVYAVRFASDGPSAYSAGGGRWIQIWEPLKAKAEAGDAGDMEERFAKEGHTRYIEHGLIGDIFALAVREGQVFAGSAGGQVKQFAVDTLKETHAYPGLTDWVFALDVDPAAHRLAAGSYNGTVCVWDTNTGRAVVTFKAQPSERLDKTTR